MATGRPFRISRGIEWLLAIGVLAGFVDLVRRVIVFGYIPLPFVYDVSDTFMDWFNPSFWGHNNHAYSAYTSVYAPLSFVITNIFSVPTCYYGDNAHPKDVRACDWLGIGAIFASYILCVILAALAFRKQDRSTWLARTIAFGLGLPLLYALERGNLIMIAFIFTIAFFSLSKSRAMAAFNAAMMINMKSYLLFPVLALAFKRDWRLLELCGFATVGLYLVTLAIYGSGTPFELAHNLQVWFNAMTSVVWDQISYSTTYAPFLQFDKHGYPVRQFLPDHVVRVITISINIELVASRLVALLCIAFAWFYPKAISMPRLAFFLIMQSFVIDNPGGYAQSLIVFLILLERWNNARIGLAIIAAYLISIPTDMLFAAVLKIPRDAWITQREAETVYGITWGALLRPALLLVMLWSLAIDSLIEFHRAIRRGPPQLGLTPRKPMTPKVWAET